MARNGGAPSQLSARFRNRRFILAYRAITALVGEELSSFVAYLATAHADSLATGLENCPAFITQLVRRLEIQPVLTRILIADSAIPSLVILLRAYTFTLFMHLHLPTVLIASTAPALHPFSL